MEKILKLLKIEIFKNLVDDDYFTIKLITDLICYLISCSNNNNVLLDINLYDRFYKNKKIDRQTKYLIDSYIDEKNIKFNIKGE